MLSKKSKIEQLPKSRKSRFLVASAAASLSRIRTKLCGRSFVIRRGPSHRRARNAPAVLKKFFHPPEKPFSTVSAISRSLLLVGGSFVRQCCHHLAHVLDTDSALPSGHERRPNP